MIDYLTLSLAFVPSILLVVGVCAVAVWAARLPDEQSSLVAKLTSEIDPADTGSSCNKGEDACLYGGSDAYGYVHTSSELGCGIYSSSQRPDQLATIVFGYPAFDSTGAVGGHA